MPNDYKNKVCIVVAGATATGKSDVAFEIAQKLDTQIVSADSRQCYRELNIGVAKPPQEYLEKVTHHFIDSHSIQDLVSAADFEAFALAALAKIFAKNDFAVVVGGTGLYINALLKGLDPIPKVDIRIREDLSNAYAEKGMDWLRAELEKNDPLFAEKGEMRNPQRMLRALEVKLGTGLSVMSYQNNQAKQRPFKFQQYQLQLPRELIYQRINSRVDAMVGDGLVEEVRSLLPYQHLNALQTVGYKELFEHFEGDVPFAEAIGNIKKNTRHYAKRQVTWFNKVENMLAVSPADLKRIFKI